MDIETIVMDLIVAAGEAKSLAMQALQQAKRGQWAGAEEMMVASSEAVRRAHAVQTELIGLDEGEGKLPVTLIVVHAQDHIMTAMLAREMIAEMIELYKQMNSVKETA